VEHVELVRTSAGNASFVEIEGAGHGVNVQRKEEVNRRIVEFLQE